ncbi:MAG: ABC transporter permease [Pseudomonadota bacterium]
MSEGFDERAAMGALEAMGERRFGRVNWLGLMTLCERECRRFLAIPAQTVLAPLMTAALFLLIFDVAFGAARGDVMGFAFVTFLAPGLMAMSVIQNAFANTSSSLISAKVNGNIVDTLMPPLSGFELTIGYLAGGIGRGLLIALTLLLAGVVFLGIEIAHPLAALGFIVLGSAFMGALGLLAAMQAQKFDQMSALTNFVVTPLAFLSGTFYSVTALPPVLEAITRANPFFYAIDGMRWSILGVSDSAPQLAFAVLGFASAVVVVLVWLGFRTGYRLKA